MDGERRAGENVEYISLDKLIKDWRANSAEPELAVKHIDLVQKKEFFAYGGLAHNAAGSRSSSGPENACVF